MSAGELMALSRETIKDLSNKVVQNLAKKCKHIRKGLGDIMGGKVLDLEAIRIWKEGRNEGRNEGHARFFLLKKPILLEKRVCTPYNKNCLKERLDGKY